MRSAFKITSPLARRLRVRDFFRDLNSYPYANPAAAGTSPDELAAIGFEIAAWNARNPIGAAVIVPGIDPAQPRVVTTTSSQAFLLNGRKAAVCCGELRGIFPLDSVESIHEKLNDTIAATASNHDDLFAVIVTGGGVFAVGRTCGEAIENARPWIVKENQYRLDDIAEGFTDEINVPPRVHIARCAWRFAVEFERRGHGQPVPVPYKITGGVVDFDMNDPL